MSAINHGFKTGAVKKHAIHVVSIPQHCHATVQYTVFAAIEWWGVIEIRYIFGKFHMLTFICAFLLAVHVLYWFRKILMLWHPQFVRGTVYLQLQQGLWQRRK